MPSVHIANYVDMTYMFNINAGVGKGRANQRLDVMLIQYLLAHARNSEVFAGGGSDSRIIPPELAKEPFKADGICGPKTLRYIAHYQAFRNANNQYSMGNEFDIKSRVATDGAIDPWRYPSKLNFKHAASTEVLNNSSTLVALCYDSARSFEFTQYSFNDMPQDLKRLLLAH